MDILILNPFEAIVEINVFEENSDASFVFKLCSLTLHLSDLI